MINIKRIKVDVAKRGHITNVYIIYNQNNKGILIDPGYDYKKIINEIKKNDIAIDSIVITHAHADHIGALEKIQEYTKAKIYIHEKDYGALIGNNECYYDLLGVERQYLNLSDIIKLKDGDILNVDDMRFEIIHTPGHTIGSICIYESNLDVLFTGDTLFKDCYGRCDLFSGSFDDMVNSLRKIFNRFETEKIYPGHDEISDIPSAKKYIRMLLALKGLVL